MRYSQQSLNRKLQQSNMKLFESHDEPLEAWPESQILRKTPT